MCRISVLALMGVWIVLLAAPVYGDESGQMTGHRELSTIVTKIASGVIFVEPFEGLRPRTISPSKADRVGLHEAKLGDEVTLILDEGNILVDAHRSGIPPAGHRLVRGNLHYADTYWGEVRLSTPEGPEHFEVDSMAGSKLSVFQEGASIAVELDEDNMVIDIHRAR